MKKKIIDYLENTENPYQLKVGDVIVEMTYSDNNRKFDECVLNILKQRLRQ